MSQELKGGGNITTSFTTGQVCTKTGLYKSNDGKIEFIEYIALNSTFPPFPGGTGTKKCTWTRLSVTTDGTRSGFTSVMVDAGTI